MKKIIVVFALLLIVALILDGVDAQQRQGRRRGNRRRRPREQCHGKEVDKCLEKVHQMTKGPNPSRIIKTEEGVNKLCETTEQTTKCFKGYMKKCGTPLQRELFEFAIEYFVKTVEQFCTGDNDLKRTFLKHSPCINDKVIESDEYKATCISDYLVAVEHIAKVNSSDDKLDTLCCSQNQWEQCAHAQIVTQCGEEAKASFITFTDKAFGGLSSTICPSKIFNPKAKICKKALPPAGTKPKGKSSENPVSRYLSAYFAFLFQPSR